MIILALVALVVLVVLSALFSSSETVLFSLTTAQKARLRPGDAKRVERCLAEPAVLFSTLLVGNTFVNFAIAALGFRLFSRFLPGASWLSVPVMTLVLLVFGEITPKRLALRFAPALASPCARFVWFWRAILTPFNRFFQWSSRPFGAALERERRALSDEELVSVLEAGVEHGEVASEVADQVSGVLRLSELCANDEMTPRVDMEGVDVEGEGARSREQGARSREQGARSREQGASVVGRHHYLPIYRRSMDQIEGVLDAHTGERQEALFVPETVTLDDLLETLVRQGKPLAIVLDEYGGTAGMITRNDILELVLGPDALGHASDEPKIVKRSRNVWEVDGRVSLEELNRTLDLELEAEDADRLAGWVQAACERIPHVGESIEEQGVRATVLKRRHRRVTLVRLEVLKRPDADTDEELLADTDEAVEKTKEDDA